METSVHNLVTVIPFMPLIRYKSQKACMIRSFVVGALVSDIAESSYYMNSFIIRIKFHGLNTFTKIVGCNEKTGNYNKAIKNGKGAIDV